MAEDQEWKEAERFFVEHFHQQWTVWSEVTRMLHLVEENELHRKQGFRDLSSWLASIRLKTVAGVSRYQPGKTSHFPGTAQPPDQASSPIVPMKQALPTKIPSGE